MAENSKGEWVEKRFPGQIDMGWGQTFGMVRKAPLISKRIFSTLENLKGFINDPMSSAIEGLILTVVEDGTNNGAYLVTGVRRYPTDDNGSIDYNSKPTGEGKYIKLGASDNTQNLFEIVTERPEIGEEGKIYLVRKEVTEGGVVYEEWIYKNNSWGDEPIGTQTLDFDIDNIYDKNTIDGKFSEVNNRLDNVYTKGEVYTKDQVDGLLENLPSGGGGTVSGDYIPTSAIKTGTVSDESDENLVASASHNHDGSPVYTSIIAHTDSKPKDGEEGDVNSNFAGIDIKDTSVSIGYHTDEGDDARSIIEIGADCLNSEHDNELLPYIKFFSGEKELINIGTDYLDSEQGNVLAPYIKIYNGGNELNLIQEILYLKQKVEELSAIAGISGVTNITSKNIGDFAVTSLTPVEDDIVISGKTGDVKISVVNISKVLFDDAELISNNDKNN